MALTATATSLSVHMLHRSIDTTEYARSVQDDIIDSLGMSEENLLRVTHPFNRANLFYEVSFTSLHSPTSPHRIVYRFDTYHHQIRTRT